MNKLKFETKYLIASILIIALIGAVVCLGVSINNTEETEAEVSGINGYVSSDYVPLSEYNTSGKTIYQISKWDAAQSGNTIGLKQWLALTDNTYYGVLTADFSIDSASMYGLLIKNHYLDGNGHKITINATTGAYANFIISGSFTANCTTTVFDDSDTLSSTISSYSSRGTPFGYGDKKGFYAAGYLGGILYYSAIKNVNFEFNNAYAYSASSNRGLAAGLLFGYAYQSGFDNCSMVVKGTASLYKTSPDNNDGEGVNTICFGGYVGALDGYASYIKNSKIVMNKGSFFSAYSLGYSNTVLWAHNYAKYGRSFIGGMVGSIVNSANIINVTAAGSGDIRAWAGGGTYDNNLCGAGIIAGINVTSGPAGSAYTPKNCGDNSSGSSTAASGIIDGVICSWTGIAAYYIGTEEEYIYASESGDKWYHAAALDGTVAFSVNNYFYGGLICGEASGDSVRNVFYTINKIDYYRIAWDNYRRLAGSTSNYLNASKTDAGVQAVGVSDSSPNINFIDLKYLTSDGYISTAGKWTNAAYSNPSNYQLFDEFFEYADIDAFESGKTYRFYDSDNNKWVIRTNETFDSNKDYYVYTIDTTLFPKSGTVSTNGSIGNTNYYDIFNLEWEGTTEEAGLNAVVNCKKIPNFNYTQGLIAWDIEVDGETTHLYAQKTSVEDAINSYTVYSKSVIKNRIVGGKNMSLTASTGRAVTYKLNDTFLEQGLGTKEYDGVSGLDTPPAYLYTYRYDTKALAAAEVIVSGKTTYVEYEEVGKLTNDQYNVRTYYKKTGTNTYSPATSYEANATYYEKVDAYKPINDAIWSVYREGSATRSNLASIKEANTYTIKIFNGATSMSDPNARYAFLDSVNRTVAYRGDYAKYNSTKSETYEYIIEQKEIVASWNHAPEDFIYAGPNGYFNNGTSFAYQYTSGKASGDSAAPSVNMLYYRIKYNEYEADSLEPGVEYYFFDGDDYVYVGKYSDDENFYVLADITAFAPATTYYTYDALNEVYEEVLDTSGTPDANTTYYTQVAKTESEYQKRGYIKVNNITDAGYYKIIINGISSDNYKFSDTDLVTEYEIKVSPRMLKVEYKNLNNLVYNATAKNITWILTDAGKTANYSSGAANAASDVASAYIVIHNACESTAVTVSYNANKGEYTIARDFYISIILGQSGNYVLPTLAYVTSDETAAEIEAATTITSTTLTRTVTIKKADVSLLREDSTVGSKADAVYYEDNRAYNTYTALGYNVAAKQRDIIFKGASKTGCYYETATYQGFNGIPCVFKGVDKSDKGFDIVYSQITYYPAYLDNDGKFVVDTDTETGYSIVTKQGWYVAVVTFDSETYFNYNEQTKYIAFYVEGIDLTLTVNASTLDKELDYTATPYTDNYIGVEDSRVNNDGVITITYKIGELTYAVVSGRITAQDNSNNAGLSFNFYILNNDYEGSDEDCIILSDKKYAPTTSIKDAGEYLVVVGHDTLSYNGYHATTRNYTGCTALPNKYNDLPYFIVTISPIEIEINDVNASKIYGTLFNSSDIAYNKTAVDAQILEGDAVTITFEAKKGLIDGFPKAATVGEYDITATSSNRNYHFTVNGTNQFKVYRAPLEFTLNQNITKTYGTEFNLGSLTRSNITLSKGQFQTGDSLDAYTFISSGANASASVGQYGFVGTYTVATTYKPLETYYVREGTSLANYVYKQVSIIEDDFNNGTYYIMNTGLASGTNIDNYYIIITGTITVTPKTIKVESVTKPSDLTYDATEKTVSVTFDDVLGYQYADISAFGSDTYYTYVDGYYTKVEYSIAYTPGEYYTYSNGVYTLAVISEFAEGVTYYTKDEVYNEVAENAEFNPANTYYTHDSAYEAVTTFSQDSDVVGYYVKVEEDISPANIAYVFDNGTTYYTYDSNLDEYSAALGLTAFANGVAYYTQNISYIGNTAAYNANTTYYVIESTEYVEAEITTFDSEKTYYTFAQNAEAYDSNLTYYLPDADKLFVEAELTDDFVESSDSYYLRHEVNKATEAYDPDETYYTYDDVEEEYVEETINPFAGGTYYVVDEITYTKVTLAKDSLDANIYCTTDNGTDYVDLPAFDTFETGIVYYIRTPEHYDAATTYAPGVVYYNGGHEPVNVIAFEENTTYYLKDYVYTAITTTDNFVPGTTYYTKNNTVYNPAGNISAFTQGIEYYTYTKPTFTEAVGAFDSTKVYYVANAQEVNAVVVYNDTANLIPKNAGAYTVTVTGITGADVGNYAFTAETNVDWGFTITPIELTLKINDFEMGYGDTTLTNADGYELISGTDFIASDIASGRVVLVYKAASDAMAKEPGQFTANAVYLELEGEAKDSYNWQYQLEGTGSYGKLTVLAKELVSIELKDDVIVYDKNATIKDLVQVDTANQGDFEKTKYEKLVGEDPLDESNWEEVTGAIDEVGTYRVTVTLSSAASSANYSTSGGSEVVKTFTVAPATWKESDFKASDFKIYWDHVEYVGEFEGAIVKISDNGAFGDGDTSIRTISNLNPMTPYTIYIKVYATKNYSASQVMQVQVTTSYNPNLINNALRDLGSSFTFNDIDKYKAIKDNYDNKVSPLDYSKVNSDALQAAEDRYNLLINSGNKAIKITKQAIGKAMNKTYAVATAVGAVSGLGLALAGLSCMTMRKKKQNKKSMRKLNKKSLLVILVMVVMIATFAMVFVGCGKKEKTPEDDNEETSATVFFTAAGSISNPKVTVDLLSVADDKVIYSRSADGTESKTVKELTIDAGSFTDTANSLVFRADSFSETSINGQTFEGKIKNPQEYLGITADGVTITEVKVIINLNKDDSLKDVQIKALMTVDTIEYKAEIKITK